MKANLNVTCRIVYRFYDDNAGLQKQIRKQGMNLIEDFEERQAGMKIILENEIGILEESYNPIRNSLIKRSSVG